MKLLLDTQIFLWYISADPKLSLTHRDAIQDASNEVYLSVASVWEAVIKHQLGKLPLPVSPEIYLPHQRQRHLIDSLPVEESNLRALAALPPLHRDPFDRLIISQALDKKLILVTVDLEILKYPVTTLADS